MATDAELFGNFGTEGEPAEAATLPQEQDGTERRTDSKPAETKPATWREDPEFRALQSKLDKRYDEERKKSESLAARLAQYEQTLDTLATKDLDDTGKLAYENRKLKQTIAMIEQEKQITEGRQRVFNRIRQKAGMPIPDEVFDEATDADHAWELAVDYMLQRNTPQQKQAAKAEKKEANQVYLGSTSTTIDDWEAKAARLLKNKDAIGYARHVLERKE